MLLLLLLLSFATGFGLSILDMIVVGVVKVKMSDVVEHCYCVFVEDSMTAGLDC